MAVNSFLNQTDLAKVQQKYVTTFDKVDTLENTISNLGNSYLALSGGQLTGDVTTTNTTFSNTSFVTKQWVQNNTVSGSFVPIAGTTITFNNLTDNFTIKGTYGTSSNSISLDGNNIILSNTINIGGENEKTTEVLFNDEGLRSDAFIIQENLYQRLFIDKNEMSFSGNRFEVGNGSYKFAIGRVFDEDTEQTSQFYLYKNSVPHGFIIDTYTNDNQDYLRITGTTINDNVTSNSPIYINGKLLSTQNTAESFTNNNEFVTKLYVDNHTQDLSNYTTKEEYNALLASYNDLAERLNAFLVATGNLPDFPLSDSNTKFKTIANTSQATFTYKQGLTNNFTIDWGDGTETQQSGTTVNNSATLTHNYSTAGQYTITITNNKLNEEDSFINLGGTDLNQFVYVNIVDMMWESNATNNTVKKWYYGNQTVGCSDSWSQYVIRWSALEEAYLRADDNENSSATYKVAFNGTTALKKVTIDTDKINNEGTIFTGCTALQEVHIISDTLYTDSNITLFPENEIPENVKIYVPTTKLNDYKTAWSTYASIIEAEPEE